MKGFLKVFALAIAAVVGGLILLCLPSSAQADQITIANSTSGTYSFTGTGTGSLDVSTSGLSGFGLFDASLGTYTLGATSFTAGPETAGQFPTTGTESFAYGGGGNSLTGTITYSFIRDNTLDPTFFGNLLVSAVSGSPSFTTDFPVGSVDHLDMTLVPLSGGVTLDTLSGTTNSENGAISSGQITPVPEPSSLSLFSMGTLLPLGGYGFFRRRRRIG